MFISSLFMSNASIFLFIDALSYDLTNGYFFSALESEVMNLTAA